MAFAGFAIGMYVAIFNGYLEARDAMGWTPTPCTIEKSDVKTDGAGKYEFTATYRYNWEGGTYVGYLYRRRHATSTPEIMPRRC